MDSPASTTGSSPVPGESPAQEKARLRRERRNQKIQAGGASRLQAITSLNGGRQTSIDPTLGTSPQITPLATQTTPSASPAPPKPTASASIHHDDPAEVDISEHHYIPAAQARPSQELNPFAFPGTSTPHFPPSPAGNGPSQDPMMAMLQQMMGGAGGIPGMEGMGGMPGLGGMPGGPGGPFPQGGEGSAPPGLAQLMQAMQQGGGQQLPPPSQSSAYLWRIVHSVFSLLLAVYIIVQTPFTGSKISRTTSPVTPLQSSDDWTLESPAETFKHFFYIFATFEVMMQTTRFFVERGQLQGGGMLSTIGQMLPEPWAGIVRTVGRYGVIWKTVVSDAMVVVFVLGLASWWRGGMVA